jgi:hypothetical protein
MFTNECPPFDGTFAGDCQQRSIPSSLLTLITMILHGTNFKNETIINHKQHYLSHSCYFITLFTIRKKESTDTRHSRDHEPPLPLFLGAYVHSKTRSKDMIDTLCKMGLSVTYGRVLCMFADLANSAINHFEAIGAVCPQSLKLGLFTTSAVDNIDHDSTLTSAQTSFHGTGISLFQHPDVHNVSIEQAHYPLANSNCKIVKLPNDYTSVPAVMGIKDPPIPEINELKKPDSKVDLVAETQWCHHVCDAISVPQDLDNSNEEPNGEARKHVSWAAYHANHEDESEDESKTAISALLPLFPDDSKTVAMIKHSMDVVKKSVNILNPGQTPIIACDQPLYKIAKDIQWHLVS